MRKHKKTSFNTLTLKILLAYSRVLYRTPFSRTELAHINKVRGISNYTVHFMYMIMREKLNRKMWGTTNKYSTVYTVHIRVWSRG